jgi:hypothetical protein
VAALPLVLQEICLLEELLLVELELPHLSIEAVVSELLPAQRIFLFFGTKGFASKKNKNKQGYLPGSCSALAALLPPLAPAAAFLPAPPPAAPRPPSSGHSAGLPVLAPPPPRSQRAKREGGKGG